MFFIRCRRHAKFALMAAIFLSSLSSVNAQQFPLKEDASQTLARGLDSSSVWEGVGIGVRRSSFLLSWPLAKEVAPSNGRMDGNLFSFDIEMGYSILFRMRVGFDEDFATYVAFRSIGEESFEARMSLYEEILVTLTKKYPPSREIKKGRQLGRSGFPGPLSEMTKNYRFANDEWVTENGIKVGIYNGSLDLNGSISNDAYFKRKQNERLASELNSMLDRARDERKAQEENYAQSLDRWKGRNINKMIIDWGAPAKDYKMPNGDLIYVWEVKSGDLECRTSVFTKRGTIYDWQAFGNNCRLR